VYEGLLVSEQSSHCLLTGLKREDSIVVRLKAAIPLDSSGGMVDMGRCVRSGGEGEPARLEPNRSERVCDSS
jgi:hypothetical protein